MGEPDFIDEDMAGLELEPPVTLNSIVRDVLAAAPDSTVGVSSEELGTWGLRIHVLMSDMSRQHREMMLALGELVVAVETYRLYEFTGYGSGKEGAEAYFAATGWSHEALKTARILWNEVIPAARRLGVELDPTEPEVITSKKVRALQPLAAEERKLRLDHDEPPADRLADLQERMATILQAPEQEVFRIERDRRGVTPKTPLYLNVERRPGQSRLRASGFLDFDQIQALREGKLFYVFQIDGRDATDQELEALLTVSSDDDDDI